MKCPACSTESTGASLCPSCGAVLSPMKCRSCQADLAVGVRACSNCGTRTRPSSFSAGALVGAAVALAIGAGLFLVPGQSSSSAPSAAPAAAPMQPRPMQAPPPEPQRSPREEADQLFNQVMAASEQGNAATVTQTLPAALRAYEQLGQLDDDASFHVASLQEAGNDARAARATAEGMLARAPTHLLALSVAARAAGASGDAAAMRKYYEQLLAAYDAEVAKPLPEYRDHGRLLPIRRDEAKKALGK